MTLPDDDRQPLLTRRQLVASLAGGAAALLAAPLLRAADAAEGVEAPLPTMTVYQSPTCPCCKKWVAQAQQAGFKTVVKHTPDVLPIKRTMKVPESLWSCHTVVVGGYTLEGHVPFDLVKKLLREKPKAAGLAVGGMPAGSPGMEVGGMKDPYDVMLFQSNGRSTVYARR